MATIQPPAFAVAKLLTPPVQGLSETIARGGTSSHAGSVEPAKTTARPAPFPTQGVLAPTRVEQLNDRPATLGLRERSPGSTRALQIIERRIPIPRDPKSSLILSLSLGRHRPARDSM